MIARDVLLALIARGVTRPDARIELGVSASVLNRSIAKHNLPWPRARRGPRTCEACHTTFIGYQNRTHCDGCKAPPMKRYVAPPERCVAVVLDEMIARESWSTTLMPWERRA